MQDPARLETALRNAHNAGDTQAARRLAQELRRVRAASDDRQALIPTDEPGAGGAITQAQFDRERSGVSGLSPEQAFVESNRSRIGLGAIASGMFEGLNLSDETAGLAARVANLGGAGLDPQGVVQAERDRLERARAENPALQAQRELVGAAPLSMFGGTTLRGTVAMGSAIGAAAGAGAGETLEERAIGGAGGALVGGGSALALDRAGAGVSRAASVVSRALRNRASGNRLTRDQRRALNRFEAALRRDGMTASEARNQIEGLAADGFDDAALVDLGGDNVRRLFRGAAQRQGAASEAAEQLLERRIETHAERVGNQIARYMGGSQNYRQSVQQAVRERAERARPFYEQALGTRDAPVLANRDDFADLLDRVPRRALRNVRQSAQITGGRIGNLDAEEIALLDVQAVKFGLDDMIETASRGNNPMSSRQVAELRQLRDEFVSRMPPLYRQANEVFAGDSAMISAMLAGRRALRDDTEELAELVGGMSQAERDMFRIGIVRAVRDRAGRVRDGRNVVDTLIGDPNNRERLRLAFDDDASFNAFVSSLRREVDRVSRARFVASSTGSQSAPRLLDDRVDADMISDLAAGRPGAALARVASGVREAVTGFDQEAVDAALMEIGTQPMDRQFVQQVIERVQRQNGDETARALVSRLTAPAAVASVSAAQGG